MAQAIHLNSAFALDLSQHNSPDTMATKSQSDYK